MNPKNSKLEIMRHSAAHVMAAAVLELFPKAKFGIGPVIENGFYYDFDLKETLSAEDLLKIEKKMKELIKKDLPFQKEEMSINEAIKLFKGLKQDYKVELLQDLKTKGTTKISDDEQEVKLGKEGIVTVYKTGEFVDLCRGPHVHSTKDIKAFKLERLAGAYWRGDEKNKMLQRIYGLAFNTQKELDDYLKLLEDAKNRDHRKLGKELDLFTFSELVGKGLPLWTPKGAVIRRELERFIVDEEIKRGYQHVYTPELANVKLYETSGHYPYYKDTMYPPMEVDEDKLILRPMACPHHFMLYADKIRSYKELPLKIAELAKYYRYEKSGTLTGLIRVRSFCLSDSHIFCRPHDAKDVIKEVIELIDYSAAVLGLKKEKNYWYRLSLGDRSKEEKYFKDDAAWEKGEKILKDVLDEIKEPYYSAKDEAAFYGPKIDVQMKNILGKEDTAFTVQYDFCLPQRFNLKYINEKGKEEQPVVIHRSSIGAIERIVAFLLEHYAGALPVWLSPVQVMIANVGSAHIEFCQKLTGQLTKSGIRVETDLANETISNKIRKAEKQKIPYMLVIGDKEVSGQPLTVRIRGQKEVEKIPIAEFIKRVKKEIEDKK